MQGRVPNEQVLRNQEVSTTYKTLLRQYTVDFISKMQTLKGPLMWDTIQDDTNFGVLLHKEGLWSLYQFKEEKSLLYHLCRNQTGRFELVNNPCHPSSSECVQCYAKAPTEIQGIWKLHNFDWIQRNGGEHE